MVDEIIKERMLRELKKSLTDHWGNDNDSDKVLRDMFLTESGQCMPDGYLGEDVLVDIEDKFYFFLSAIRDQFEKYAEIYVQPSYEDTTSFFIILDNRLLYKNYWKAWNFWFESEADLVDEMYRIYLILKAKIEEAKMYAIIYWTGGGTEVKPLLDDSGSLKTFDSLFIADSAAEEIPESRVISISGVEE